MVPGRSKAGFSVQTPFTPNTTSTITCTTSPSKDDTSALLEGLSRFMSWRNTLFRRPCQPYSSYLANTIAESVKKSVQANHIHCDIRYTFPRECDFLQSRSSQLIVTQAGLADGLTSVRKRAVLEGEERTAKTKGSHSFG